MKSYILVGFLLCAIFALSCAQTCKTQSDCEEDECCSQILRFVPARCTKRPAKDQLCLKDLKQDKKDVYQLGCPCAQGTTCTTEEAFDGGIFKFQLDKCK